MEMNNMEIPTYSPVCMIYSQLNLRELEQILASYATSENSYGPLRIIRAKDEFGNYRDTNRTIAVISENLFHTLIDNGLYKPVRSEDRPSCDFRIVPYEIRENNLPKAGSKKDLFIRLPMSLNLMTKDLENMLNEKMAPFVRFGIIRADQYAIKIPLRNKSRETGQAHGSCFLTFKDNVSEHTAALIKAVIDDTYWDNTQETFHCFWARENPNTNNKFSKKSH